MIKRYYTRDEVVALLKEIILSARTASVQPVKKAKIARRGVGFARRRHHRQRRAVTSRARIAEYLSRIWDDDDELL